jgi:hypothetical protein
LRESHRSRELLDPVCVINIQSGIYCFQNQAIANRKALIRRLVIELIASSGASLLKVR